MKQDFFSFGGGGGGGTPRRLGLTRRLLQRYMRDRLDAAPLDDARSTVRVGVIGAILFFGLFFAFAMLAPLSGAAVAEGEVSVSGQRVAIQPVGTGLVSELLVHEGQQVRAGQPLVRLNGVRSGAQLRQAQARRDVLRAAEARLAAERDGLDRLVFPPDLASRSADPTAAAAMGAQLALFQRHRAILQADRSLTETQLAVARAKRDSSVRQLALVNDELDGIQQLYAKGFARKTTVRALERSIAQLQADSIAGGAQIEEAEINRRRTRDAQMLALVSELNSVQEQLAQVNPQLDISRYYADRDLLRAPAAGRVAGVAQVGPGMVVNGGRTLMEIVPTGRTLIVEARVKPEDIDDVRVGAEATVRFTTVNPRGESSFKGRVVTLSPARVEDPKGGPGHYRAQIVLNDPAAAASTGLALQPGIPANVNIKTKERTLWDYLVAPLGDAMSRSMREE